MNKLKAFEDFAAKLRYSQRLTDQMFDHIMPLLKASFMEGLRQAPIEDCQTCATLGMMEGEVCGTCGADSDFVENEDMDIYEDVYGQLVDMIEPYVQREGLNPNGPFPASVVDSFSMLLEYWRMHNQKKDSVEAFAEFALQAALRLGTDYSAEQFKQLLVDRLRYSVDCEQCNDTKVVTDTQNVDWPCPWCRASESAEAFSVPNVGYLVEQKNGLSLGPMVRTLSEIPEGLFDPEIDKISPLCRSSVALDLNEDAKIIRGLVALSKIGWAPELCYDDDGHWRIVADTGCTLPWYDSPREAWLGFVNTRLKEDPEAYASIISVL